MERKKKIVEDKNNKTSIKSLFLSHNRKFNMSGNIEYKKLQDITI